MKKKMSLMTTLILVGVMPLLLMSICLCLISSNKLSKSLEESVYGRLKVAAEGLDMYYTWDIVNTGEAAYEHDYVDNLEEQGIEQTLFLGDTRYITSIKDAKTGERNEGTQADPTIYKEVSKGNDYSSDGVEIGGNKYYVYYTPVQDEDGNVVGMAFAGEKQETVDKEVTSAVRSLLITTIILAILFAGAVVYIANYIRKPIADIVNSTKTLSQGILNEPILAISMVQEIDVLINAAKELQSNLATTISGVYNNVNNLDSNMDSVTYGVDTCNQASEDVVGAVDGLARGTMDMADSVQNCSESMQEIGNDIAAITDLAEDANSNASEVRTISEGAKKQLSDLIEANMKTVSISQNVVAGINEASEAAEQVRTAAQVITDIAGQTNLLALNASIEAARAGEAGSGFAVVASSIQTLANQSDESAKQIQNIIHNIINISDENVRLATDIRNAVDNEGSVLENVNTSFNTVNDKIVTTADAISSIKQKATQLNVVKDTVIDEVSTLSAISEQNAAECQETNASMEELKANVDTIYQQALDTKDVSGKLSEAVAFFNIDK